MISGLGFDGFELDIRPLATHCARRMELTRCRAPSD
jgi:hypothetical protein